MAIKHMIYVFEHPTLKGADRLMMLAIADYADEAGSCYPSYNRLAKKCNVSDRSAKATVKRLEDVGEIAVVRFAGIKTPSGNTNRYFMIRWRELNGFKSDDLSIIKPSRGEADDTAETSRGEADNTARGEADDTARGEADDTLTQEYPKSIPSNISADKSAGAETVKRNHLFDWVASTIFNVPAEVKITKSTAGRTAKALKAIRDIHEANDSELSLKALNAFKRWYKSKYVDMVIPKDANKLAEYYTAFYAEATLKPMPVADNVPTYSDYGWLNDLTEGGK